MSGSVKARARVRRSRSRGSTVVACSCSPAARRAEAKGLGDEGAVFLDASATGDDVFFTTRAQLVPEDKNEQIDVYDARVNGGFPTAHTACSGTRLPGRPPAPPTFATPASVTFSGTGNFPPLASVVVKPKTKTVICKKGDVKNHKGKCVPKKKKKSKAKKSTHTNAKEPDELVLE